jgi:hypothetical protein
MSNILQQLLASQEGNVKHIAGQTCTYNGTSVNVLVGDSVRSREQTEMGAEEYYDLYISVYKTDVATVTLKTDVVVYGGLNYVVTECNDADAMWHLRLTLKSIKERSNDKYRK